MKISCILCLETRSKKLKNHQVEEKRFEFHQGIYYLVLKERIIQVYIKATRKCYTCWCPIDWKYHVQFLSRFQQFAVFLGDINMNDLQENRILSSDSFIMTLKVSLMDPLLGVNHPEKNQIWKANVNNPRIESAPGLHCISQWYSYVWRDNACSHPFCQSLQQRLIISYTSLKIRMNQKI